MNVDEQTVQATVSVAVSALTKEMYSIGWLMLAGMAVGMASVGFIRKFLPTVEGGTPAEWRKRSDDLKKLGAISALAWTMIVEYLYVHFSLGLSSLASVLVGIGPGVVAGAVNDYAFRPVKFAWAWAMSILKKRAQADGQGTDVTDKLDDTTFTKK